MVDYYRNSFGAEDQESFREAQNHAITSLAGYSILQYVMQIKDRHNGNILVDDRGHIIHIDFGFIMDISPGGNLGFENAPFKLTREMVGVIEGWESTGNFYETSSGRLFEMLVRRGYLACQQRFGPLFAVVQIA